MTVTGKRFRGRVYTRKFDYEEARRRHAAGETISALAREYGASQARVRQVVNPEAGRLADERAAAYRWPCVDCGKPKRSSRERCVECAAIVAATTVRDNELWCNSCRRWLPDDMFHRASQLTARRGRRRRCKPCDHADRADYRRRHPEEQRVYDRNYNRTRRRARQ
jgi:hypothetical protein